MYNLKSQVIKLQRTKVYECTINLEDGLPLQKEALAKRGDTLLWTEKATVTLA